MNTTKLRPKSSLFLIATMMTLSLWGAAGPATGRRVLSGHVPAVVGKLNLQPIGRVPATNQLRLAIGLPLRNTNDLERLLQEIYNPASPQFRHYLTPEQFTERFGPTPRDYDAVSQFARRQGLTITGTHSNRAVLDVAGNVGDIEKAFHITLRTYQHPAEGRQFYAPDVEPSVDAGLAVLDVSGLNNYLIPRPASLRASDSSGIPPATGSGPDHNFIGKDLRNAYAPGVTQTGAGQTVGLLAFQAFYSGDITTYETMAGLPNVPIQVILLDGFDGIPTPDSDAIGEASLDVEMAISMAPGLSNVVVFDAGPSGNLNDILTAMTEHPLIKQLSSSWAGFEQSASLDNLYKQLASQGQSYFQASGDADSWANNVFLPINSSITWPEEDAYLTSVGGTSLTMNDSGASYASEKVWNWGDIPPGWNGSGFTGSGGGFSTLYAIPSWQQGLDMSANRGSASKRNYPDVAALAENYVVVADGSTTTGWGGTSFASPLWAGFMALVNQAATDNGQPSVGFLNPAIYALGQSADYTNNLNDITVGNNATATSAGLFPAVPGYDLCTGWGSPRGSNLIYALAFPQRLGVAPKSDLLFIGPVGGAFMPDALNYSLTNGNGFSPTNQYPSLPWSLGLDADWLTVSPMNGTNLAGGPPAVITVAPNLLASNLAAGSYTATLYFTNLNDLSVQTRQVALEIVTVPLITSQPTNQTVLEGMTASFSVETASNTLLSYQWQFTEGGGVTNLTDGGGISGSATSSLTVENVSPEDVGAYSVIVSNAAGSVSSSNASLAILTRLRASDPLRALEPNPSPWSHRSIDGICSR